MTAVADAQEIADLTAAITELLADAGGVGPARAMEGTGLDHDERLWNQLGVQMGLAGIGLPEAVGGLGGLGEIVAVAGALGTTLAPVPFWSSTVLAGQVLAGIDPLPVEVLTELVDGGLAAAAIADADGNWSSERVAVRARADDEGWRLEGLVHFVAGGASARWIVVAAAVPEGTDVFLVESAADGVVATLAPSLDLSRPLSSVQLSGAAAQRLTGGGTGAAVVDRAVDVALVALAAEQAAGARRALDVTVAYAKVRHQFSRPIGGFQAVKHRLVDLLGQVEFAASAVDRAVMVAEDPSALSEAAAVASAWCGDAYRDVCADMVQLHGGLGFTWEHDAHLFFRRAHADAVLLGDPDWHRERIATLLAW